MFFFFFFQNCKNGFIVGEHLDASGVISLMEVSLQNPGTSSVHIDVGIRCAVQHMRSLSESEKRLCSMEDQKQ